jgi:hypothetical protein
MNANTPAPAAAAATLVLSLLVPAVARAQDPMPPLPAPSASTYNYAPAAPPAEPPPPPPAAAPPAPPPLPAPAVVVEPSSTMGCFLGTHAGIDDADAQTAGHLVCDEIASDGGLPGSRYRVDIGKLGSIIILSVSRLGDKPGTTADSRELRLQSIEEVSVAAPRLAHAIVRGTPIGETETTENLVGQETRQPKTKPGSIHFALGLSGLMPPLDQGLSPAAGLIMDWHYEANRFEMGVGLRGGGGSAGNNSPTLGYFMVDVGGRYFFSDADISPYVGGGLEWMYLNLQVPNEGFQGNNGGLGAFADAGIEILRTHHAHLAIGARLDLPFFSIDNSSGGSVPSSGYSSTNAPLTTTAMNSTYFAPVSLEMRLTF